MDIKQVELNNIATFHMPQKETGDIRNLPDVNLLIIGGHEVISEGRVFPIRPQLLWSHKIPMEFPVATLHQDPGGMVYQGQHIQVIRHNAEVACQQVLSETEFGAGW